MSNQTFDFTSALEITQEGGRVARINWEPGTFLFLVKGETVTSSIEACYGDPNTKGIHTVADTIYLHDFDGVLSPWFADSNNLLASDWIKL